MFSLYNLELLFTYVYTSYPCIYQEFLHMALRESKENSKVN